MWKWHQQRADAPLICLLSDDLVEKFGDFFDKTIERQYVPEPDLISAACRFSGASEAAINRAIDRYERLQTAPDAFPGFDRKKLTLYACEGFAETLPLLLEITEEPQEFRVPGQVAAPLRFVTQDGAVDILDAREHSLVDPIVLGSARGAAAQADDLSTFPGFKNAVPNFEKRLGRITGMLQQISEGDYDDSTVVQLGTETVGFEHVINGAREMVGETAHTEAAAFFSVLYALLGQYAVWGEFKAHAAELRTVDTVETFHAAEEVLRSLASDIDGASPQTRNRIKEYMEGLPGSEVTVQRDGAISSAENALASATAHIIRGGRDLTEEVATKVKDKLTDQASDGIVKFLAGNAPKIADFAKKSAIPWLLDICRHLGIG